MWHRSAHLGPPGPADHPSEHRVWIIVSTFVVLVVLGVVTGQLLGRVLAAGLQALFGTGS